MADVAALHREMIDAVGIRDWERLAALYHGDYTYTSGDGETQGGAEVGLAVAQTYTAAFPDIAFEIRHQYTVGNVSVIEFTARGTHEAELEGIPATGRRVEIPVCNVVEERDGLILHEREYFDSGAMMQQLGLTEDRAAAQRAIVGEVYEAFGRGDVDAILEHISDEVAWDQDIPHWGLPWYEPRSDKAGVRGFFAAVAENLEFSAFEPVAMIASDDRVAAVIRFELTIKSTGKTVRDTEIHLWTFGPNNEVTAFSHIVDQHGQVLAFGG